MLDLLVIGAGIVGVWTALTACRRGMTVAVCDDGAGDGISARNSGVLHAGLYYPQKSLKAFHCLRGRKLTIEFLKSENLPFEICGKLIVPGESGVEGRNSVSVAIKPEEKLQELYENSIRNGIEDIEIISNPQTVCSFVKGRSAIHSRGTGVVDVSVYLNSLRRIAEQEGVVFLYGRKATEAGPGFTVMESDKAEREEIQSRLIVNSAGLNSDEVAGLFGITDYKIVPNKGEYFRLRRQLPCRKLIYPLPVSSEKGALGVHYTFHLNGESYAGPSTLPAQNKSDYKIESDAEKFHQSLLKIINFYGSDDFEPGYAGLRPRLFYREQPFPDFKILESPEGVWHLLGIESPGLTSAPSLAMEVIDLAEGRKTLLAESP